MRNFGKGVPHLKLANPPKEDEEKAGSAKKGWRREEVVAARGGDRHPTSQWIVARRLLTHL